MKKIVDAVTVVLLAAAFILAYHTGFVAVTTAGEPVLATSTLALISVLGVGVLFGVGGASTAYDRMKRGMVTKSFLALVIVQIAAVVGMAAIMIFLLTDMFTVENTVLRALYIVFAMICVIGYVDAMLYSDSMAEYDALAEDDGEDDTDDEDADEADDESDEADADEDAESDADESDKEGSDD